MEIEKVTHTRDGYPWRLYAKDSGGPWPVHGAYKAGTIWYAGQWNDEGVYHLPDHSHLELAPTADHAHMYQALQLIIGPINDTPWHEVRDQDVRAWIDAAQKLEDES